MTKKLKKIPAETVRGFDCAVSGRLQRMGLINSDGTENPEAMRIFTQIYAGLLFDDLLDSLSGQSELKDVMAAFSELASRKDGKRIFLLLSILYDRLRKPLPEPVWWLMGEVSSMETFAFGFVEHLLNMANEENLWKGEHSHETADCCPG